MKMPTCTLSLLLLSLLVACSPNGPAAPETSCSLQIRLGKSCVPAGQEHTYEVTVTGPGMTQIGPTNYQGGQIVKFYVPPGTDRAFFVCRYLDTLLLDTGTTVTAIGSALQEVMVTLSPVDGWPVTLVQHPDDTTVDEGDVAVFVVGASGTGLTYQWYCNGSAVTDGSGGTTDTYTTGALSLTDDGNEYRCVITTATDTAASSIATVTVNDTTPPGPVVLTDSSIVAGQTVTLDAGRVHELLGFVYVDSGATLIIPAGTVIKGNPGGGLNASALIVCRGATIEANGTASEPIIFTSTSDDLSAPDDLGPDTRGLWGGVIILGNAVTSMGVNQVEGIADDPRSDYGGTDPADNSGTLRYVSIRYGGTSIGDGNEINGLTLGGVGSGTTIDHVEVFNNADDGFEFFGGTVNTSYLVSAGCGDDSFDWDEGYLGNGQFWVTVQAEGAGDRAIEGDGLDAAHYGQGGESRPTIYNATFVGSGALSGNVGNTVLKLRAETGAYIFNSIFTDFFGNAVYDSGSSSYTSATVVDIDDSQPASGGNYPSAQIAAGTLVIRSNIFYGFPGGIIDPSLLIADDVAGTFVVDSLAVWNTWDQDPGVSRTSLLPTAGGPAFTVTREPLSGGFFASADYCGAFGATDWTEGWTVCSSMQ